MHSNTKEILEKIHNIQSGKELANLCDEIYAKMAQTSEESVKEQLLAMNYAFYLENDENVNDILAAFRDFVIAVFELVSETTEEEADKDTETKEEADVFSSRFNRMAPFPNRRTPAINRAWKELDVDEIGDVSPIRTGDRREGRLLEPQCFSLISKCDLRGEGIPNLGADKDAFYENLLTKKKDSILVFCLPNDKTGHEEFNCIHKYFPIKKIQFTRVTDEDYARQCIEEIYALNPDCKIDKKSIVSRISALRSQNEFLGKSSLELIKTECLYNDLIQHTVVEHVSPIGFEELAVKYQKLNQSVNEIVKGQREAVSQVVKSLFAVDLEQNRGKRKGPKASFLLMGPPGVGKTLLAETISNELGLPYLVLNMSDYSARNSFIDLVGSSKRFRGGSEGKLVEFVRKNPKSIIVFDEIEKASLDVIHLFLQILDMGILLNAFTEQYVKFGETIIFFTSNVGKSLYDDERNRFLSRIPKSIIVDTLESEKNPVTQDPFFPQAICSRMASGNICMMNRMDTDVLLEIMQNSLKKTITGLENIYGFSIEIDPGVYKLFLYQQGSKMDARIASKKSIDFIKDELYEISRLSDENNPLMDGKKKIRFEISKELDSEFEELFRTSELNGRILFFGDYQIPISENKIKLESITSIELLEEVFSKEYTFVLVDPFYGYEKENLEKVCINDVKSVGMDAFRKLMACNTEIPVYILDRTNSFHDVDIESFILDGATGVISGDINLSEQELTRIVARHDFINRHADFCSRGYTLKFSSKQLINGDELIIQFYNVQKVLAPDSKSAKLMVSEAERPTVKLNDIIGAEEAKDQLQFFIKYLRDPQKALISGGKAPKGVLLYGPPGTGKTMLAKSLAGETDAAFIATSASELLAPLWGEGEANIRRIFATARRYAPAIIFIDEIDAIGKMRTGESNMAGVEAMLNALLTEMDGFSTNPRKPVLVIAATNFGILGDSDKQVNLDSALLRRFDNQVFVDLPNEDGRLKYLKQVCGDEEGITDDTLKNIAKRSLGKSIADLENIINLAYRNAARDESKLTDDILLDAYEQAEFGLKKERGEEYYRKVAIHEAGHAVIAQLSGSTPAFMTITGRANFGGYVESDVDEDKGTYTETELRWRIREKLAGRIAEKIFLGEEASINTGSSSDLAQATNLALDMITKYGFMPGQLAVFTPKLFEMMNGTEDYVAKANDLLLEEFSNCERILTENMDLVQKLADAVMEKNYLTQEQIRAVLEKT
ncbi:MAG: AAA family ATPase [Lachnospiraceae bacterium]